VRAYRRGWLRTFVQPSDVTAKMYVRRNVRTYRGKTYTNYLLVESVRTPAGPRQRTICSLGDLGPAPRNIWLDRARKLERALVEGAEQIEPENIDAGAQTSGQSASSTPGRETAKAPDALGGEARAAVEPYAITAELNCEIGPVHVGYQFWRRLGLDQILQEIGLPETVRRLACAMTLNFLVAPANEREMLDWMRRAGLAELLGIDVDNLTEAKLHEVLDALHPHRTAIEAALIKRERSLFDLDSSVYLCDLASISVLRPSDHGYVNGNATQGDAHEIPGEGVEAAVAIALGRHGFPICHEVVSGDIDDSAALSAILSRMAERGGLTKGAIVNIDRRLSDGDNLAVLKQRELNYVITSGESDRERELARFAKATDFAQIMRIPPAANADVRSPRVDVLLRDQHGKNYVLCHDGRRIARDRLLRRRQERFLAADLDRLRARIGDRTLASPEAINEAIGGLKERYPRVSSYCRIDYDSAANSLSFVKDAAKASYAGLLDGSSLLETDLADISTDEARGLHSLLARVREAFLDMRTSVGGRRIFSRVGSRSEVQILLQVLAFHLTEAIERILRRNTPHRSWVVVREILRSHQLCTIVVPTGDDRCLRIREAVKPYPDVEALYAALGVPAQVIEANQSWDCSFSAGLPEARRVSRGRS
jgi:hypothetical protein